MKSWLNLNVELLACEMVGKEIYDYKQFYKRIIFVLTWREETCSIYYERFEDIHFNKHLQS